MNRKDRELYGEIRGIVNWHKALEIRMAEKQKWKDEPGNRCTAEELNAEMRSLREGNLTITPKSKRKDARKRSKRG